MSERDPAEFDKQIDLKPVRKPAPVTISAGDAVLYFVIGTILTLTIGKTIDRTVTEAVRPYVASAVRAIGLE